MEQLIYYIILRKLVGAWCLVNLNIANLGTALNAQVPVQSHGREATSSIRGWVIINNSDHVKLAFRSMGEVKVNYTMESIHPALVSTASGAGLHHG